MNKIKTFITKILRGYFNDEDKKELIEILTTSLEEKVDDLVEQGTPMEEAINKSISEFGNTEDILKAFPEKYTRMQQIKKKRNELFFSIWGYVIIVGIAIFINFQFYTFFKEFYWFVLVCLGLLFWPLAMLYRYLQVKK